MAELSLYEKARRESEQFYTPQLLRLAQQRYLTGQAYEREGKNILESFQKSLPRLASAYGQRGLVGSGVKSGIYGRAGTELAKEYQKQTEELGSRRQAEMLGMDIQTAQLWSDWDKTLADLEASKAQEIREAAQNLLKLNK